MTAASCAASDIAGREMSDGITIAIEKQTAVATAAVFMRSRPAGIGRSGLRARS